MLIIIKAEDVRDGEPRIWLTHRQDMPRMSTKTMHTSSRRDAGCQSCDFAIVDRPSPTPAPAPGPTYCEIHQHAKWCEHNGGVMGATGWEAPAPGLDLEAIERAERAMTAGPWTAKGCSFQHGIVQRSGNGAAHGFQDDPPCSFDQGAANAAGIAALRNAATALTAEVRALRARLAESTAAAVALAAESDGLRAGLAEARATIDEIGPARFDAEVKLAQAKNIGRNAAAAIRLSKTTSDETIAEAMAAALEAL